MKYEDLKSISKADLSTDQNFADQDEGQKILGIGMCNMYGTDQQRIILPYALLLPYLSKVLLR